MTDYGHKYTDSQLAELEKRLKREYAQALSEMQEKTRKTLERFSQADKKMLAKLNTNQITHSEYLEWRRKAVLRSTQVQALTRDLSQRLVESDKIASDMINGYAPKVYAENANFATYLIESDSKINTSFTLMNQDAVKALIVDNKLSLPKSKIDIPKDKRWNEQKIKSALTQGIMQGEGIPKIAKRLQSVTDMDRKAATRNARTLMTGAQSAGRMESMYRSQNLGIGIKKMWVSTLDNVTRDSHVDLDGEVRDLDKPFSNGLDYPGASGPPEEVYNCFIADTEVAVDSEILRGYKHWYDGEVISIKTASGVNFTCTPNHPILTPDGWIKANLLNNGQDLLVTSAINSHDSRRNPHINHVFTRFDALFELLEKVGGKWTSALGMNFHGDVSTSDVEIISKKGFLRNHRNTINGKKVDKFLFKSTNSTSMSHCTLVEHFRRIRLSTLGFICRLSKSLAFFGRGTCHSKIHSIGATSRYDTLFFKAMNNNCSSDPELFCKSLDRLARVVFTDKIVDIKIDSFHGYVYNLQTDDNYYFVNSILSNNGIFAIAHNCRCTVIPEYDKYRTDPSLLSERNTDKLGNMSYQEWKDAHKKQGVNLGNTGVGYTTEQQNAMMTLIKGADPVTRAVYEKFAPNLDPVAPLDMNKDTEKSAYYSHADKKVHFNQEIAANGGSCDMPFQTHFHEYGHNIDYMSGSGNKAASQLWRSKDGKTFGEVINDEWDKLFKSEPALGELRGNFDVSKGGMGGANYVDYMIREWAGSQGLSRRDPIVQALRDEVREIGDNLPLLESFYYDHWDKFKQVTSFTADDYRDYFTGLKYELMRKTSLVARGDLSDMLEPFVVKNIGKDCEYPLGCGHGWEYTKRPQALETETFAEMFDSEMTNPESLELIKKYLPESYRAYREILGGLLK